MKKNQIDAINTAFQNFEAALSGVRLTVSESALVLRALDNLRTTLNQNLVVSQENSSVTPPNQNTSNLQ